MENQLAQPIQTTQPLQSTPPIQQAIIPEKPKTNYSLIVKLFLLVSIMSVGLFLYLRYWRVGLNPTGKILKETTATQQPLPFSNDHTASSSIAYLKYSDSFPRGDVYLKNLSTGIEKQLTNSLNIREIIGFSPDNKYLLVQTEDIVTDRAYWKTQVLDTTNLILKPIPVNADLISPSPIWNTSEIIFCDNSSKRFYKVNPSTLILDNPISDVLAYCPNIYSPDIKWSIYNNDGEGSSSEFVIQSVNNPKITFTINDSTSGREVRIWQGDKLLINKLDGLFRLDPSNNFNLEKLVSLNLVDYKIGGLRDKVFAILSKDKKFLYYETKKYSKDTSRRISDQLFKYSLVTKENSLVTDLMNFETKNLDGTPADLENYNLTGISKDELYLLFDSGGLAVTYNTNTSEFKQLCEDVQCNNPVFNN